MYETLIPEPQTYNYQAVIELTTYDWNDEKQAALRNKLSESVFEFQIGEVSKVDDLDCIEITLSTDTINFDLHELLGGFGEIEIKREQEG